MPSHEAQTRPLIGVPPSLAQAAWRKALAEAKGKTVTARLLRETLNQVMGKTATKPADKNGRKSFPAKHWAPALATPGVEFLSIFGMPLLGYLGYLFFAWELCALRNFLWPKAPALRI